MGSLSTVMNANNVTRVARAQYRASVANTANTNRLESSKSSFGDFMRSFRNKAVATAASKEYNYQMDQLSEELRTSGNASMTTQVQLAVARGALQAQAGYVGVGGSSADLMDTMVGLQAEMDLEAQDNARALLASRGATRTATVMSNAYGGMDISRTFGSFDFRQYVEPVAMKNRFGALVGAAVATYFGGPRAGSAVLDMTVGNWQAANGDFAGASQSYDSGIQKGIGAFKSYGERGGQAWGDALAEGSGWKKSGVGSTARVTTSAAASAAMGVGSGSLGWFDNNNGGGNGYW